MTEELRIVATAGNETEAEMIGEWLSEAGIRSMPQLSSRGIRLGPAAERDICVEAKDYDRALEVINGEAPSEAELAALSEAAATQQSQATRVRTRSHQSRHATLSVQQSQKCMYILASRE